jgi:hypothetical protein
MTHNKEYFLAWAKAYKEQIYDPFGVTYITTTRLEKVDEEIAQTLRESGCSKISVGIETGSQAHRTKTLRKPLTDKQIYRGMTALKKSNLRVGVCVMAGFPGETIEDVFSTFEMCRKIDPDYLSINFFSPLPGLDLTKVAIAQGYLDEGYAFEDYNSFDINLDLEDKRQINALVKLWPIYKKYPFRPLFRILASLPLNRLYNFSHFSPRIKAILTHEMEGVSFPKKTQWLLCALKNIAEGRRPQNYSID